MSARRKTRSAVRAGESDATCAPAYRAPRTPRETDADRERRRGLSTAPAPHRTQDRRDHDGEAGSVEQRVRERKRKRQSTQHHGPETRGLTHRGPHREVGEHVVDQRQHEAGEGCETRLRRQRRAPQHRPARTAGRADQDEARDLRQEERGQRDSVGVEAGIDGLGEATDERAAAHTHQSPGGEVAALINSTFGSPAVA